MNISLLEWLTLAAASVPAALFLANLRIYRRLPVEIGARRPVSVLIPARNEALNIRATLESVLANRGCDFEVIVLDDHSTDETAHIVARIAASDGRVRLEEAPPLPSGWCGKQHACAVLARLSRSPFLVFMDADVRLAPDALRRMSQFMQKSSVALASGVPRQDLQTLSERLLIPLIHFVLLGFLPMRAMRKTRWGALAAGCGQLFVARREAYEAVGGHAQIRASLHDGIKLPRAFRKAGFATDLFDATDLACCRMYRTNGETWRGLGKNAIEGLAAPGRIIPMTLLLALGQILPWVLLARDVNPLSVAAVICSLAPRWIAASKFKQPWLGAFLHPVAMVCLLLIQWYALLRHLLGKPAEWKGRRYSGAAPMQPAI